VLLVTLPRQSQRLVLVVPTATDYVPRISDYAAIFVPTHLLDRTILSSAASSSISMDFISSSFVLGLTQTVNKACCCRSWCGLTLSCCLRQEFRRLGVRLRHGLFRHTVRMYILAASLYRGAHSILSYRVRLTYFTPFIVSSRNLAGR